MLYAGYNLELENDRIIFDREINIDRLDWKNGDRFELTIINGHPQLVKVEPVLTSVKGYK